MFIPASKNARASGGFLLFEITVIIAIIAVIATVAIPNLLRARQDANEDSAVSILVELIKAQDTYREESDIDNFSDELERLAEEGLIDSVLGSGEKSGYKFTLSSIDPLATWTATASPLGACTTGSRNFTVDQTKAPRPEEVESEDVICPRRSTNFARIASDLRKRLAEYVEEDRDPLDRSDTGLSPKEVLSLANRLASDRDFQNLAIDALDENGDGNLSFEEVFRTDLLAAARTIMRSPALPSIPWRDADPDARVGDDRKLIRASQVATIQMRRSLGLEDQSVNPELVTSVALPLPE